MTVKPKRKVIGSITGEVFETRSAKTPRRRLPDGRTETGRPLAADHPEYEGEKPEDKIIVGNIDIEVEEDGLEFESGTLTMNEGPTMPTGTIDISEAPQPEPIRGKQSPKTTQKDIDKFQDLFLALSAVMDDNNYSAEDKALIISKLFADTTDVRVETMQYVMSAQTYGLLAGSVALLLLLKGQGAGLLSNYRRMMASRAEGQTKVDDVWGDGK
tara:strand:- start:311 stop:952 length:642 start_codon:yes stop_codon:yes gene_type:complete